MSILRSKDVRVRMITGRTKNTAWKCWPRAVKSYLASDERETVRRLFRKYGIKYTKEKRRLRVLHKIPWGVEFNIRHPGACPEAGTWNGGLECFLQVWSDSTPEEKTAFVAQSLSLDPRRN